ncbi:MAG: nicotinate phosphoribosyltransferase [Mycoplasmatales bacterium]|nr:nicotinate phosphoribosyltransferase [Mycoplasmatales bacterium]
MKKYTAKYFDKTSRIIEKHLPNSIVTLQFFQRQNDSILCGINEVLKFLEKNTQTSKYEILYLKEGSKINSGDIVLQLKGNYVQFGIYEGVIDGILSRATSLATNAYHALKESNGKEVIYMGDRQDHYINQTLDGYAISLGGIKKQVTDAHVELHDGISVGTMPHALIQMFEGDLIKSLHAYKDTFKNEKLTALVDFNNDVIADSLKALKEFGKNLSAVRVDTSANLSDKMFPNNEEYGVTPNMISRLRNELNKANGNHVKIIVSSGFDAQKIKNFENKKSPVDVYGVGSSLLKIKNSFTADAVEINGKKISKVGRGIKPVSNLVKY